jgi:hypothetical protein
MESAEGVPKAGIEENRSSWYREMMVSAKTEISQILGYCATLFYTTRTTSRDSRTRRHHRRDRWFPAPLISVSSSLLFRASRGIWDALQHE